MKTISKLLVLSGTLFFFNSSYAQFSGSGAGTSGDPYLITSPAQLNEVRDDLAAFYKLSNDIDLSTETGDASGAFWDNGRGWDPIGEFSSSPFTGEFDGGGFTIDGLTINRGTENFGGLFGYTDDATIKNVTFTNLDIVADEWSGGAVGYMIGSNGLMENVHAASGTVACTNYVGGLVGWSESTITECSATLNVSGTNRIGILLGENRGDIEKCYTIGQVTGNAFIGGIAGNNDSDGKITNSYTVSEVNGQQSTTAGITGSNQSSTSLSIRYVYTVVDVTTDGVVGSGLIGTGTSSIDTYSDLGTCSGTVTTAEMIDEATYENWDFSESGAWTIADGTYPYLRWQSAAIAENTPEDFPAPTPDETTLADLTYQCSVESLTSPTATDNCDNEVTGTTDQTFPITEQGEYTITWSYTGNNGKTTTQTQNITIDDTTAPEPTSDTLSAVYGVCEVTSLDAPTADDNCDGEIEGTTDTQLPITAQDTTIVTWTYTDTEGNSTTQQQAVILSDDDAPVPNVTTLDDVIADCNGQITSLDAPTATDACTGEITGTTDITLPISTVGETEVVWTYADGNGNEVTQTQTVIVPITYAVAEDTTICEGTSYTFPDGTSGTTSMEYVSTLSSIYGCDSVITTTLTVLPLPEVDLGEDEVFACVGDELAFGIDEDATDFATYSINTLFGNEVTDDSLRFTFNETFAATASTQDVFVTIKLTDDNGCVGTDQVVLRDNTLKNWAIGGVQNSDPTIVISNTILPETADSFEWDFGDGNTNTADINPTHTYVENGVYIITLSVFNECDSDNLSVEVTINNACTVDDASVSFVEGTITASASGFTYQWIDCNTDLPISGATSQSYTPDAIGSYAVDISDGSCTVRSECTVVIELPLNVGREIFVKVYPNPVSDRLRIEGNINFYQNALIIDMTGKSIKQIADLQQEISTVDLKPGIYFLNLIGENTNRNIRFIKE